MSRNYFYEYLNEIDSNKELRLEIVRKCRESLGLDVEIKTRLIKQINSLNWFDLNKLMVILDEEAVRYEVLKYDAPFFVSVLKQKAKKEWGVIIKEINSAKH